jgi:putative CocE/NonD family hydrolase
VKVPVLHISGWYDCCPEPPIRNFQAIRRLAREPLARDNQQLMLGPWTHQVGGSTIGELDFGPSARLHPDSVAVRWFDRWLKGEDNGVERQPPVRVFVMGANRWREATDWPIPGTRFTNFYLRSAGDARLARGGGGLSTEPPGDEPADRYTYDPAHPTPAVASDSGEVPLGPADRTPLESRDDVLVYTSEALRSPIEVTGPLSAVIYAATSAPSTDFFVRLIDVHPDGRAYNVFQIYATAPFRSHWAKEVTTGPGGERVRKAEIWLPPTSVRFGAGHRIRVEISSAYAPPFRGLNVEPGTELTATRWNVARQTIYHDRERPSHVILPVIPP